MSHAPTPTKRAAVSDQLRSSVIDLRQCSIFVDSDPIKRAMNTAADRIEEVIAERTKITEAACGLVHAAQSWLKLYAAARSPIATSNTAFVDVRALEAFASETRSAVAAADAAGLVPHNLTPESRDE